jgi:hypothetical protein
MPIQRKERFEYQGISIGYRIIYLNIRVFPLNIRVFWRGNYR